MEIVLLLCLEKDARMLNLMKVSSIRYDKSFKKDSSAFRSKFVYPFISGATAAAVATTLTQPFDVVKTNIQVGRESKMRHLQRDLLHCCIKIISLGHG